MDGSGSEIASFGPFRLAAAHREVERDGVPLALGPRALDILIVLVERAGEIVSHRDLIARVWRGLEVSPGNLRVHMSALRKALGNGEDGNRYIENVTGQGYTFVAPVTRSNTSHATTSASTKSHQLPLALARMVGRDDTVRTIAADLRVDRFVTIVGPGGMGKTTVAVSVAHAMLDEFAGQVCFIDLGAIGNPDLLPTTVASTLGLTIQSKDIRATLSAFLRTTRMLLVFDNCEHVIDAVASLAEMIFSQAPDAYILATSREALRVEGEHAHWLRPLASPPADANVTAAQAMTFPAVRLFVERATARDGRFQLTNANASIVANICSRLDGIALAIELAAGRIGTFGLEGTAELLSKHLGLLWQGRRTALPRHQTLQALLDWSYDLLPEPEQRVLRKLSIFVGMFSLTAARAVAADVRLSDMQLVDALEQLVAKSLVSTVKTPAGATCYRLLETTRIYALKKLEACAEADVTAEGHARYFEQLLNSMSDRLARHEYLGNVRAALEWCFGDTQTPRNAALGVDLAAASAPTFLELSLWSESLKWSEAALTHLDDSPLGDKRELMLQEARAISSMLNRVASDDVRISFIRAIDIAKRLGEADIQLRLLAALQAYLIRMTDCTSLLELDAELETLSRTTADTSSRVIADWLRGSSKHFMGHQAIAKQLFESGLALGPIREAPQFGFDYRVRALTALARVLWLCGYPDRALRTARDAIAEAARTGKPLNVSYTYIFTYPVFVWCGDLTGAQEVVEQLLTYSHWPGLIGFHPEGLAMQGEMLARRGELEAGIGLLRRALADMKNRRQYLSTTLTACCLAEALATSGRLDDALGVVDDAMESAPAGANALELPELLRLKANILLSLSRSFEADAEHCLAGSLRLARDQGAKGWELRTTLTLARLRSAQGRDVEARDLASNIYAQFTEGFDTQDLKAAEQLLRATDDAARSVA